MKKFKEQVHKEAMKTRMTVSELRDLRTRLTSYVEYHPLPEKLAEKKARQYLSSQPFISVRLNNFYTRVTASAFAFLLLVGVPLIAERAVPGDTLYPVKVRFNEEVRSSLTFTEYQKIEWETERIERRVSEARLLAREGKLTAEYEAEVAEAVLAHTEAAQESIDALREDDAEEAAIAEIAFESALEVQSAVLAVEEGEVVAEGASVVAIADAVEEAQETAAADKGTTTPSYERLLGRVEQETTRAVELLESIRDAASAEEALDIDRRLSDIDRKISEAISRNERDADLALGLLTEALSDTQKLITFMTDIDIRTSVTIEELVPVEYTKEERLANLESGLELVRELRTLVVDRQAGITDSELLEKVALGLAELERQIADIRGAQSENDLDTAETGLALALEHAEDLVFITESVPAVPVDEATGSSTDEVIETEETASSTLETPAEAEAGTETETVEIDTETSSEEPAETEPAQVSEEVVSEEAAPESAETPGT